VNGEVTIDLKALRRLSLQVVVPTVRGREAWLEECLESIRGQAGGEKVGVLVSGNGTSETTRRIALSYECDFKFQRERVPPEAHMLLIHSYFKSDFVWLIGDDDHMSPNALYKVLTLLEKAEETGLRPAAVIGRVQYFSAPDKSDLGIPMPGYWKPGTYSNLTDIGEATHGGNHLGAFVFDSQLFTAQDLEKYGGTEHSIFGAFWEGLERARGATTYVLDEVLLHMRQAKKEWDASPTEVRLGVKRLVKLLPPEIARHRVHYRNTHLTRTKALELASVATREDRHILKALVAEFNSFSIGSRGLARVTPRSARFLYKFAVSWMGAINVLYSRMLKLREIRG